MRNLLFFKTSLLILLGFPFCLLSQEDKPSNWDRKRIDARVITMDQDTFYGQVLKANESTLTMWMSQEPYDHKNSEIEIKEFASNEINQIFLKRDGKILGKVVGSTVAGGGIGGIWLAIVASPHWEGSDLAIFTAVGAFVGAAAGSLIGTIWGLSSDIYKKMKTEGDQEKYLKHLPYLKKRIVLVE